MKTTFLTAAISLAGLVLLSACATTDDEYAGMPDEGVTAEGTEYTCRRIRVTGSRLSERVCASNADWEEQARRTQEGVDAVGAGNRGPVRPGEFAGPGR
ncbi:hypothetical protein [Maricaulis parjimensis]|uniref:hypothetical protein n=1 Tax=Maricaulis parjimensis TaxID=144023 RepID=UPI001939EFD0|nr:hypothetical protein [Maricaulis parjimensis]